MKNQLRIVDEANRLALGGPELSDGDRVGRDAVEQLDCNKEAEAPRLGRELSD